jgi:hypothetical protein
MGAFTLFVQLFVYVSNLLRQNGIMCLQSANYKKTKAGNTLTAFVTASSLRLATARHYLFLDPDGWSSIKENATEPAWQLAGCLIPRFGESCPIEVNKRTSWFILFAKASAV